jgi:hypothetical protein
MIRAPTLTEPRTVDSDGEASASERSTAAPQGHTHQMSCRVGRRIPDTAGTPPASSAGTTDDHNPSKAVGYDANGEPLYAPRGIRFRERAAVTSRFAAHVKEVDC